MRKNPIKNAEVFISSTIYDFKDLRSALKFWLEQHGFRVQLSEDNDFDKPLDKNSYEACLDAVRRADIFILLVGGRLGGLYSKEENLSITQKEYRTALEEHKKRGMPIISFIRRSTWEILHHHLEITKTRKLPQAKNKRKSNAQTKAIDNPEHLHGFLNEIRRRADMVEAIKAQQPFPSGNWIHQFETFEDITRALAVSLKVKRSIATEALLKMVKDELLDFLSSKVIDCEESSIFYTDFISELEPVIKMSINNFMSRGDSSCELNNNQIAKLVYMAGYMLVPSFQPLALKAAAYGGHFIEYDLSTGQGRPTELQKLLQKTHTSILALSKDYFLTEVKKHASKILEQCADSKFRTSTAINSHPLIMLITLAKQVQMTINIACNLLSHLEYETPIGETPILSLSLLTPFTDELQKKKPNSREDLMALVKATAVKRHA